MNKKIAILLLTIVQWSVTQAQFTDHFSDGDFLSNPEWSGDDSKFIIDNEQLRLMAPAESSAVYLSLACSAIRNATWEFYVRMEFNPSSSNLTRVYLVADQQNLSGELKGYYVQLGGTEDEISLYKQSELTRTKIIDGQNGRLNLAMSETRIRVTRDEHGQWELFSDVGLSNSFLKEGEVVDTTFPAASFFGVFCSYTATRSTSFYFDDFEVSGEPYIPPLPSQWKDIIFTEIYADPSSSNGLPDAEFVELFNRTDKLIDINGWRFADASVGVSLTGEIEPNEYIILTTSSSKSDFESWGKVIGMNNFPSLNNVGDVLTLKDSQGNLIDSLNYTDSWYKDAEKKSGGWSLELIDPENPCGESENWIASESSVGATPGTQNSVFANKPDLTPPILLNAIPQRVNLLILNFNEKLKKEIPTLSNFQITPPIEIESIEFGNSALTQLLLGLKQELNTATAYVIRATGIRDCNDNSMEENSVTFGLPEAPNILDVVINEILFNPRPTGTDFVELYNPSDKYFNLKDWSLGNLTDGNPTNIRKIASDNLMLAPREFKVVTADPETIVSHYPKTVRSSMYTAQLPTLADDEGSLVLLSSDNIIVDGLVYSDAMHSIFLKDDDGVSLERITPLATTQDEENWKSASSTEGFATPGYLNSNIRTNSIILSDEVTISPEIFIPITGKPDFTEIHYQFDQGVLVANVKIVNSQGVLVKQIANNATLGTSGFFRWDGDQENGSKARVGYYVVWFQVYDAHGNVQTIRKRVVIAAPF